MATSKTMPRQLAEGVKELLRTVPDQVAMQTALSAMPAARQAWRREWLRAQGEYLPD